MSATSILCKHCGNEFHSNWPAAQYCSDKCRVAAFRERKKSEPKGMKICPGCYQRFAAKNSKKRFCSDACKMACYRQRKEITDMYQNQPVERFLEPIPVEVVYNEAQAIKNAWSEAIE